jgi:hypothetical protein
LRASWSKDSLSTAHPDVVLKTASIPYAKVFGFEEEEQELSIQEYIDQIMVESAPDAPPPRYIFSATRSSLPTNSSLHGAIFTPQFAVDKDNIATVSPQWYLGAPKTGAPLHFHTNAINILVHGRKRWSLLPPRHSLYSKKHIVTWTQEDLPGLVDVAKHCIQEPGDVLYVPESWSHGVENLVKGFSLLASAIFRFAPRDELRSMRIIHACC